MTKCYSVVGNDGNTKLIGADNRDPPSKGNKFNWTRALNYVILQKETKPENVDNYKQKIPFLLTLEDNFAI